ncbi:RND family transporter: Niemann-Pick type C1 disease protein-like protein, partial [Reticulomyxa filosa]
FWKFSPNVVQVLPFVAIGLGVDDMYVMLQCFYFNDKLSPQEMVAKSLETSGASVTLTTLANFLAFLIASFMPLPDVNRFAQFGMVMVVLHYISIIFGFTAVLALLARRMKNGYNDFSWLCLWQPFTRAEPSTVKSQQPPTNQVSVLDPLFDFMTRDDIRIGLLVVFCTFLGAGLYGVSLIHIGLPLDSIVPASYGQDYLQVRGKYYHSYINSLYTDGYRSDIKPINWSTKFETWLDESEKILTLDTDLVYQNPKIHSFWAWDFRDYNKNNYFTYFNPEGYKATFYKAPSTPTGKSSDCEPNRLTYCSSENANYTYGTNLYYCLLNNTIVLSEECLAFVQEITPEPTTYTIAKQVQIYSPDDSSVAGVYTAPSSDVTNVYYRSDGAVVYQLSDNSWAILDVNYNLKYIGLSTLDASPPPQYGWTDTKNNWVAMTTIYYDTSSYSAGAKRGDGFKETDDASLFVFLS